MQKTCYADVIFVDFSWLAKLKVPLWWLILQWVKLKKKHPEISHLGLLIVHVVTKKLC